MQKLRDSPIDWKTGSLGESTQKRHLPVSTQYFMEHLLCLEHQELQKIKSRCEEEKLYVDGAGWPSLHARMADDDENGSALLHVAAAIISFIDAQKRTFNPIWVDSSEADGSVHSCGYGLLWGMEEIGKLEKDTGKSEAEDKKNAAAWWLRAHTVVVSTPDQPGDPSEDSIQFLLVVRTLRNILLSQPNRRFVFGLLLCGTALYVLLADRTSIFYSETPINIHEDPLSFIHAVAALSLLSPEKLGYDPTMKIWVPGKEPLHIWDEALHLEDLEACRYNIHWVIEMPVPGGRRAQFITLCVLYLQRASMQMSIVWAVVNKEDMMLKDHKNKIYVLKQCLSPSRNLVNVYSKNELSDDLFYSTEDVEAITADEIANLNSTAGVIPLPRYYDSRITPPAAAGHDSPLDLNVLGKKRKRSANDEGPELVPPSTGCNSASPRHWIQRRTLLKKLGWPLIRAATLTEYVRTIKDAVQDHRRLYRNGVLHRDVSQGNILIFPTTSNVRETKGGLIDLDNSKLADETIKPLLFRETRTEKAPRDSLAKPNLEAAFQAACIELEPDFLDIFLKLMRNDSLKGYSAEWWAGLACSMKNILGVEKISSADLGFHTNETVQLPNFRDQDARLRGNRSVATIPFASSEVLTPSQPIFSTDAFCSHDAVHDLESFLWVMTEHCLLRSGPGGELRPEFNPLSRHNFLSTGDQALRSLYESFFGSSTSAEVISRNKRTTFRSEHDYENCLLPYVHPYFEPLKPYLRRLFMLVRTAHRFGLDDIYTPFLRVLSQAEETFLDLQLPITPASENEFLRRENHLKALQSFKDDHHDVDELDLLI
ncbi:hypothetical protein M413DRAFT_24192 [Hebeloma cylindrosporum]|uniref:Fungal-type protein kinase domain-containing protein n=1 Tax=Hebeloma cylindrosporum TaxID=76867 RepID=A0A0C3CRD1_HEBCY|nr:hypothetical protein M413DRAFT_24192 [Hebeloma cylindrosporum h7]